jgi:hypothetical protein
VIPEETNIMDLFDDFPPVAVEGVGATAAELSAPACEPAEPDPDWLPL